MPSRQSKPEQVKSLEATLWEAADGAVHKRDPLPEVPLHGTRSPRNVAVHDVRARR